MKHFIFKAIYVMVVALVAQVSAKAQVVNQNISTSDYNACKEYLQANPSDTVLNKISNITINGVEGEILNLVYRRGDNIVLRTDTILFKKEVVESVVKDENSVKALEKASDDSRYVRMHYDVAKGYDLIVYKSADVREYRHFEDGDTLDTGAGIIAAKGARKYGWSVRAHLGYSFAEGLNAPLGGIGVMYDRRYWGVSLNAEAGQSRYSSYAVNAGDKYWVFRTEATGLVQPFTFDNFNQHRLWLFGGLGFETFDSGSQESENGYLRSKGNNIYLTFGAEYEYRFFATGNSIGARAQWRNTRAIVQNYNDEHFGSVAVSLFFKFGAHRNKFDYTK